MDLRFWRWAKQREYDARQREWDAQTEWANDMIANGWHHWAYVSPPPALAHSPIEMMRRGWPMILIGILRDVPPATNVNGLWWRECGGIEIDCDSAA